MPSTWKSQVLSAFADRSNFAFDVKADRKGYARSGEYRKIIPRRPGNQLAKQIVEDGGDMHCIASSAFSFLPNTMKFFPL